MKELEEVSVNYATEKTNEMMSQIVAQAFADGYRMGYKDREDEIPVDLRDGKSEFVDLGLPSGTLWSADFENEGDRLFIPYVEAQKYDIPTWEQCCELFKECQFVQKGEQFICIGPNGKHVNFAKTGYRQLDNDDLLYNIASIFWMQPDKDSPNNVARIVDSRGISKDSYKEFTGYRLPIRLVKTE